MEWEFSPEDVLKGSVAYGLEEFRRDLAQEVRANLGDDGDELRLTHGYNLIYDLCYALATGVELDAHLRSYAYDPPLVQYLRDISPWLEANVAMLGAILQRQIMDRVEAGMRLEDALGDVAQWHVRIVDGRLPASH
jgi:hypothetical protein